MSLPAERVIALIPDLMAAVRLESAALAAGVVLEAVGATDWAAAVAGGAGGAVVDLTAPEATAAVMAAAGAGIPTLAYGPHVAEADLAAARAAGAAQVLTRGQLLADPGRPLLRLLGRGP
jgi:hypothetical protein